MHLGVEGHAIRGKGHTTWCEGNAIGVYGPDWNKIKVGDPDWSSGPTLQVPKGPKWALNLFV